MFKELLLTICVGIVVGFILFLRTQHALKEAYIHHIRSKYASSSHTALKYPSLDDELAQDNERDYNIEHKFYAPPLYTDALFNPKSAETEQLRSEFSQLFTVLDTMRDFIIRDFIDFWYKSAISEDDTKFINHIKCAIDGAFQTLVKRISATNWTYFTRDRILHPLRECLILYRNIIRDLSKKNPKWNELTETERDHFIAGVIEQRYRWHRGCDSRKASIDYLRKWSLLFVEEILDERNFHCFAVRFFCRELLTNNVLHPVLELVDGYNVNYAIVAAFTYLKQNEDKIMNPTDDDTIIHENKQTNDTNKAQNNSNPSLNNTAIEEEKNTESISEKHVQHKKTETNSENKKHIKEKKRKKRKRRASLDTNVLNHYHKSFNINYFFIEINKDQSEMLQLTPFIEREGYSISCKYEIESQYEFTLRFVSTQYIDLCAKWVTLIGDNQILSDSSSLKHLKCREYDDNKFIYIKKDHMLHEYGDSYLQLGRQMMISTDIQPRNKYYNMRHVFVPLNVPLLHIYFTAAAISTSHAALESANSSISENLAKFGNAINPLNVIDNIGDGIKKLLPHNEHKPIQISPIHISKLETPRKDNKRTLFGKIKKEHHGFHHHINDINFPSSKTSKNGKIDEEKKWEQKLKLLAQHKPTRNLTIRIWDVYRDFDNKMSPYVAYVLRMRDEIALDNNNTERIEWTLKTRFSKLHSFHRAIQKNKSLKSKHIKIVAHFPTKSIITKMDSKYVAERKKQLVGYFSALHRYPDVLLCDTVYQLVIPPALILKYSDTQPQNDINNNIHTPPPIITTPIKENESFLPSTHPTLPSQQTPHKRKDSSPEISVTYSNDEDDDVLYDEKSTITITKPRRDSDSCVYINTKWKRDTYLEHKISVIGIENELKHNNNNNNNNDAAEEVDSDEKEAQDRDKRDDQETNKQMILERFRIEHYEHITPSLIRVLEAFLDLEKRGTFGSSLTLAATSMMSWFFNGYIANKLNAQSASLTMDGTLSYIVQWISDLLWIPPTYKMNEEKPVIPTQDEMDALRVEASKCIQEIFEQYIGDNVPKIIGPKKQFDRCMMKFWRFMQQNKLLKHLAFSVLDSLLQDLFVEKVSRRYLRRAWIADKNRKRIEKENKRKKRVSIRMSKEKQKVDNIQVPDILRVKSQPKMNAIAAQKSLPAKKILILKKENKNKMEQIQQTAAKPTKLQQESRTFPRTQSIPLLKDADAPNIDIFSGGSLFSDYTKKFMKGRSKKNEESSDDEEYEESTDNEDESDESEVKTPADEETVWNHGFTYSDDDAINKLKYKSRNGGFFRKLTGNKEKKKKKESKEGTRKDSEIKHEYFMY